jgi:3-dehydroquinate dehydratase-1
MKYKTCVAIAENNPKKLARIVKSALKKSDFVEIRFDFLKPKDIPDVLELVKKQLTRCVCTLRPKNEGGEFTGSEMERKSIIKLIAEYNPFLLDVEFNALQKDKKFFNYMKNSKTRILVSWHDFKKTPKIVDLTKKFTSMKKFSNYVKIVTMAKTVNDATRILSLYNNTSKAKLIAFSMGEEARFTRVLSLHMGSPFTYVSLGKPIAPGQFSLEEIRSMS